MTTERPVPANSDLEVRRDLRLALRTAESLQTSICYADTKAGILFDTLGGLAAAAAQSALCCYTARSSTRTCGGSAPPR